MLKNMRIGARLVLIGTLIMAVSLTCVALVAISVATDGVSRSNGEQLVTRTRGIAQLIDRLYLEESKIVLGISYNRDIVAATVSVNGKGVAGAAAAIAQATQILLPYKEDKNLGGVYEAVSVAGLDGIVFASSDPARPGTNLSDREYVKKALAGSANVGAVVRSKVSGNPVTPVAVPVRSGDAVVGVCMLIMSISFLNDIVSSEKVGTSGSAFIVDSAGLVVAHPQTENILKLNILKEAGMTSIAKQMMAGQSGLASYVYQRVHKTAGFAPVQATGWSVALALPDSEYAAMVSQVRNAIGIVSAAALIAAILCYILFSRTLTRPLRRGVAFAQRVAAGDFTQQFAIQQKDEVGDLAAALNSMSVKLGDMVSGIHVSAEQVAASSEEITASAQNLAEGAQSQASSLEQTSASMEELAASLGQVAEHAQSQAAAVEQGAISMEQVLQSIEEVSKNLAEIALLAGRSVDHAVQGARAVSEVVEGINLIAGSSEKIGGIVTVISDIADQTNLLALNAAIEAARAGEQGRGFAVVADEVSKLADRSSTSTKEIEGLVKESVKNVEKGVERARGSREAMEQIREASQKVQEMIGTLSESMKQQVGAVKALSSALENVKGMSRSITAAVEEQTTNAEQVSRSVASVNEVTQGAASAAEEMTASTEQLSQLAQELQKMTAHFKIDGTQGSQERRVSESASRYFL